ncbi:MAG: energy transducer TonB [Bacteroidaceae bacterium]|nr:energy transducer TonB [Bacteroidaceae bacterium]
MKTTKMLWATLFALTTLSAQAQVEEKMKAAQMRGFGARNTHAAQVGAVADSVAKAAEKETQKAQGDTDPSFPGGEIFLKAYLKKKLLHSGVSGTGDVVVSFHVDKNGNIYGAEVTKSAGSTLDTAAFNIVTGMPRWRPGLTKGEPADKPASVTVSFGQDE